MFRSLTSAPALALFFLAACSDRTAAPRGPQPPSGSTDGLIGGASSARLGSATNQATCATCHASDATPGRAGNSLADLAFHTAFKGGMATTLLDASNVCITGWMGGAALGDADPRWQALRGELEALAHPDQTTPNTPAPEVLADEAAYQAAYAGGDATAGARVYQRSCAGCHERELTVGAARAPRLAELAELSIGRIAQQVRTSGPPPSGTLDASDTTPGPMPFFEPADLSSVDLANVVAYVRAAGARP